MEIVEFRSIVAVINNRLACHRPVSLCTAFGVCESGKLEFHLLNEDTGAAIVISELDDSAKADSLADDMKAAINQCSTIKSKPEAV